MATRSKWFFHQGRVFEARDERVMTRFQIWIYEDGSPLGLHSTVSLNDVVAGLSAGRDVIGRAMDAAGEDIAAGRFEPITPLEVGVAD